MTDTDLVVVSVACASDEEARNLARLLVERRLAACVQTHAIVSTYRWQDAIETSAEVMLTAKTLTSKLIELEAMLVSHHSYEVPEIIATPMIWTSQSYAHWLRESLMGKER